MDIELVCALKNDETFCPSFWAERSFQCKSNFPSSKLRNIHFRKHRISLKRKKKIKSCSYRNLVHQNIFTCADSVSPVCCFCSLPNWLQPGAEQGIMFCGVLCNEERNRKLSLRSVDKFEIQMPSGLCGVKSGRIKPPPITGVKIKSCWFNFFLIELNQINEARRKNSVAWNDRATIRSSM